MVNSLNWNDADIVRCLGEYLTEPRPALVFARARPLSAGRFARLLAERGVELDLKSRMLFSGGLVFINGVGIRPDDAGAGRALRRLADNRRLRVRSAAGSRLVQLLHRWYCDGYVQLAAPAPD